MNENSFGDRIVDPNRDMVIYDCLPSRLRKLLQNTVFDFSAGEMKIYVERHGLKFTVKRLLEVDRITIILSRLSVWGPDYPICH